MNAKELVSVHTASVYQKTIEVIGERVNDYVSPGALARYIGDASVEHMAILGLDKNTLHSRGLLWVMASTAMWVRRLPKEGDAIRLCTWAGKERHWLYPRRCAFFSLAGEELAVTCSQWLLIDSKTRQMAPPPKLMQAIPVVSFPDEPRHPAMQMPFPVELDKNTERVVQPHEIDINGHLNNSYYLDWAVDLLDDEYLRERSLQFLWVEYCRELFAGQRISLQYEQGDDSLFVRGYAEGDHSFSIRMDYGAPKAF